MNTQIIIDLERFKDALSYQRMTYNEFYSLLLSELKHSNTLNLNGYLIQSRKYKSVLLKKNYGFIL